jgi:hypothetical protein
VTVQEVARSALAGWESFYVIIGSSSAALIGLQFVVMALVTETRRRSTMREIDAFGTPTIVHFSAVLLVSSIQSAPWPSLSSIGLVLGICGCAGVAYVGIVMARARRQSGYQPVLEDWIWHVALPFIAYAFLAAAAFALSRHAVASQFTIAGAALMLLFVGIHNAWDTVTYIALGHVEPPGPPSGEAG